MKIQISENGRFLSDENGNPFFYLADTAWEMLHRLSREETLLYLRNRAEKGFTVLQTVILAEEDGLRIPNPNGDSPLANLDPTQPVEAYFAHVDFVLEEANKLGLTLGLLPTWGDKWNVKWGVGPKVFTPENARIYGEFLGHRYRDKSNIIWILGGDRPIENEEHRAIIENMAAGIKAGGSQHLITFHPPGARGSFEFVPDAEWLDFHMWQTGHSRNAPNYERIESDYARTPIKPVLDGEPGYEDHKAGFALENGFLDDYDCRKALYWALFSGACGHTYGCHPIWQFWQKGRKAVNNPRRDWREAMNLPGASQMQFARKMHEKFPFLQGKPKQELVVSQPHTSEEKLVPASHIAAILGEDKKFALLYFPSNWSVQIRLELLEGANLRVGWFNPRNGEIESSETFSKSATREFTPPDWGPDWILTLETVD